ncbi:hypothetical protein K227x_51300 [Rubripirellula lacrimiformis]|uniref:Uncharacterized protein n=1 Tax=Rubripirellula lacrimiformis TaxID=1930273 RepID=A0A517NHV2_9BACT|nr:hypothetical protein K227x_51300 [Rubripirellula lacrimiformis]
MLPKSFENLLGGSGGASQWSFLLGFGEFEFKFKFEFKFEFKFKFKLGTDMRPKNLNSNLNSNSNYFPHAAPHHHSAGVLFPTR